MAGPTFRELHTAARAHQKPKLDADLVVNNARGAEAPPTGIFPKAAPTFHALHAAARAHQNRQPGIGDGDLGALAVRAARPQQTAPAIADVDPKRVEVYDGYARSRQGLREPNDRSGWITAAGNGSLNGLLGRASSAQRGVTVLLGYKPIDGAPIADHSYVKIVGAGGREFFLRGGPGPNTDGPASGGSAGVLAADSAGTKSAYGGNAHFGNLSVDTGYRALKVESGKADNATKVVGHVDMTFDEAMRKLLKFGDAVNAAKIKYWPLSTNSNAVSHQAVTVLGLPRPSDPVWTPGSDVTLELGR
jgi:hypothetical protein